MAGGQPCVWYVSKYVATPTQNAPGARGYMLMSELGRLNVKCLVITSDSNHLAEVPTLEANSLMVQVDGIDVIWLRTAKYNSTQSSRRILSWLHFEWRLLTFRKKGLPRPDVVIASSLSLLTILTGLWLKVIYRCQLVFEVRDIWPLTLTEEGGYSRRNPLIALLGFVEKLGYRHSDLIIGTMPNLEEHVRRVASCDTPVVCIPMGFDPRQSLTDAPALSPGYLSQHLPDDKFIVAHVGSIGVSNALEPYFMAAKALQDREDILFLLVGDGDLRARYIEQYGNLPNVAFAPKVPKGSVPLILQKCHVLYFSTRNNVVWRYGQSLNKIIDYMRSGRPIVASYSGFPSMINESGCGVIVPSEDHDALAAAIVRLASLPREELCAMGRRGRDWIEANRSFQRLAQDLFGVLFQTASRN